MDLSEDKSRLDFFLRKRRRLDPCPPTPLPDVLQSPDAADSGRQSTASPGGTPAQEEPASLHATRVRFTDDAPDTSCLDDREETPCAEASSPWGGPEGGSPSEGSLAGSDWEPSPEPPRRSRVVACKVEDPGREVEGVGCMGFRRPALRHKVSVKEDPEVGIFGGGGVVTRGGGRGEAALKVDVPARADSDKSSMGPGGGGGGGGGPRGHRRVRAAGDSEVHCGGKSSEGEGHSQESHKGAAGLYGGFSA